MSRPAAIVNEHRPGLEIRVMGPLEVRIDGRPLVVDTRKALAILVLLAVENRPYARDELAALLWPESDDLSARGALRRTLSVLRTALGDRWLRVDRALVSLERRDVWLDLAALEGVSEAQGILPIASAAGVARGAFLAGFTLRDSSDFDDWRATRAAAAERTVGRVLDLLGDVAASGGDYATATAAAIRRVDLDPLDEGSHRRLMAFLARSGDRAGAIRQYRACVAVLDRELGVAPLADTTSLYEAIRDAEADPNLEPSLVVPRHVLPPSVGSGPARLPLVGRDTALAAILDAHRSATPHGRLAVVTGEAGIGKSRLVEAAADAVRGEGGRVIVVRAYASERGVAYGLIIGLLRAGLAEDDAVERLGNLPVPVIRELERLVTLPPGIAQAGRYGTATDAPAGEPAARARLLDAIATAVACLADGHVPGFVILDDLHWADEASLEALTWMSRRLANRRVLVTCTWRPEDLEVPGPFAAIEALPETTAVPIGRFDLETVHELVLAAVPDDRPPPDVRRLFQESEGLPLYVVEALASPPDQLGGGSPWGVQALLRERISSVSDAAAQVLSAAAVIGRSFDIEQIRGTSGRTEEEAIVALEELVRRGIIREHAAGPIAAFDFAHSRLREAAYGATSLARRRLLHRRAAAVLRLGLPPRDPARLVQIAEHEREAGNDAEAAGTFREAGEQARSLHAHREAAAHLETALALGHPDVSGTQALLADVRTALGEYAGAIAALEASAALAGEPDLPDVEIRLGRVHARRGDLRTAASHLDTAIDALERRADPGDASSLVRALVERAAVAERAGQLDLATTTAVRAVDLAGAHHDAAGLGAAQRVLGLVFRDRGDLGAARSYLQQSLALADSEVDAAAAIAARNALALVEAASSNHGAAIALLEEALEACRRIGERHLEGVVENNLADELHAVGRGEEAMEHLKGAVTAFADVGGREQLEPEIWKLVAW